ncbi:TPA: hypothetical protein H1012_02120 [archaeon]|nr:hypothetical protein [Candidatus Naiadarchaeales archaeon SRR2090159.bin1288]
MTIDMSNKEVVIDDFIGGKKGMQLIKRWASNELLLRSEPLDIDLIRKSVAKQLKNKKYDLMIFVETGGVYFLDIPQISMHTKEKIAIPISERYMVFTGPEVKRHAIFMKAVREIVDKWVLKNSAIIKSTKSIAIVEGDVGQGDFSYIRLSYIKRAIQKINANAKIEIIVGIATTRQKGRKLFDIVGIIVKNHYKLSDQAASVEYLFKKKGESVIYSQIERELLRLWKTRKVPIRQKK